MNQQAGTIRSLELLETPASIEPVPSKDNMLRPLTLLEWAFALGFISVMDLNSIVNTIELGLVIGKVK